MSPRELVRLSKSLEGKSAHVVDEELRTRRLPPEERITTKHMLAATELQRHIRASLATDTAEYSINRQPTNETQRLLIRSGFRLGQRYGESDVDH